MNMKPFIPVWCHIVCWILITFGGAYCGITYGESLAIFLGVPEGWRLDLIAVSGMFFGFIVPGHLFAKLIPAKCSECGGKSWHRFEHPSIVYTCEICRKVVNTNIGPGDT